MNPLLLSGFGVSLNVDKARLIVKDGHLESTETPTTYEIRPRHAPFDSVVIDSQTGQISITAIKWLMRHNIPLFILDYNGTILSSILPKEPVVGKLKKAQIEACQNAEKRFYIAKKILEAKLSRTKDIVEWLDIRYDINVKSKARLEKYINHLEKSTNIRDLLFVEGKVAESYWSIFQSVIPKKYEFSSRISQKHQMNSTDPVNTLLNYGYAFLESRCRASINSVGLEPSIGFLHETAQPKHPLVYDLQEPFRWMIDKTVISCIEKDILEKNDFFFTDNYVLRLKPKAIKKLLEELRLSFNSNVHYKNRNYSWDMIIRLKTRELAHYILGKAKVDFNEPFPKILRSDSLEMRKRILELTQNQAKELGIGRSTLHFLRKRAGGRRSFEVYKKIHMKIKNS
ncbi:CRISPR-associated endonuclease Cas1 [Candidatus Bathyarchaeota archaeon RBG_13_38_9]|nr:MAG: CRISPR-associated endonuclease Cas1 [Candidatus Bathyarchaeota archaeon RBG_13_38_9]